MFRNVLLGGAEDVVQLLDGRLAVPESIEDADPSWLTDRTETLRNLLDEGLGEWVRKCQDRLRFVGQLHNYTSR